MRIVLVSPAWRRYQVTRVALAQRQHLCGELAGRGLEATCLVVADDDNLDIATDYGFAALESPNEPLGSKFNDGIEHACRQMEADVVAVIGSDDWLHPAMFDRLPNPNPEPPDFTADSTVLVWGDEPEIITGRMVAVVNTETGMLSRYRVPGRSGCIPWLMPREALERSGFRPASDRQQRGLDFSVMAGLRMQPTLVFHDPHDFVRVDFKSDTNMNPYSVSSRAHGAAPEEPAWDRLAEWYPAHLVDMARDLQPVAA